MITVNRNLKEEKMMCKEEKIIRDFFLRFPDDSKRRKREETTPSVSSFYTEPRRIESDILAV